MWMLHQTCIYHAPKSRITVFQSKYTSNQTISADNQVRVSRRFPEAITHVY